MNHVILFSDLTTGKLKNVLAGECRFKQLLPLVQHVNKKVIFQDISSADASKKLATLDFQALGFKGPDDFEIKETKTNTPDLINIEIKPSCVYPLQDNFTVVQAPDLRSSLFLGLFCDEFERIKARALFFMDTTDDEAKVKMYALKNLQFVKTCFHNNKSTFQSLISQNHDYENDPILFIYFYLNFFLIKVRMFYQKLFEHFIPKSKKHEVQLINELFQISPAILQNRTAALNSYLKTPVKSELEEADTPATYGKQTKQQHNFDRASSQPFPESPEYNSANSFSHEKNTQGSQSPKIRWNGQINILVDVFYQIMYEIKVDGEPLLVATPNDIANMLTNNFCDRNGNELSRSTIKTILLPSRADKRPKKDNSKRIDISKLINGNI